MKIRTATRLARLLVAGLLVAVAGLFWVDGPPSTFAQTDTTAPSISSVAITSDAGDDDVYLDDDGVYGIGDKIEVTVTFSEDVTVTGSPQLELTVGSSAKNAAYMSTTGSKVVFSYMVAVGDSDTDGISIAADKLSLNGGTIKDAGENAAELSHSAVSAQAGHMVDGIRPTITSAYLIGSSSNQDDVHTIDEYLPADVSFSEHVYVGGYPGPQMRLNFEGTTKSAAFGGAYPECSKPICVYGPGGRYGISVGFEYMIAKGDLDLDGVAINANSVVLNGGSIRDGAGNDAVLTHSAVAEDSNYIVDGVPATVKSVAVTSNPGSDNTYGVSDTIEVTVTFSESVRVPRWIGSGGVVRMPLLELNVGGVAKIARTHERSTITGTTVVFSYTVQDGDNDADGIYIGANKLTTQSNGGITDNYSGCCPGGNNANLTHSAVADDSGHKVATSAPPKSTDATLSGLTLSEIDIGTFASGTTSYNAQVLNSVSQTTVSPTVNHSGASYVIKLGGVTDSDGTVSLAVGSNVITVEVTADDDSTTKTYTVTVTRAAPSSTDATLSALTLSGINFGIFASGTASYTAEVAGSVTETTVTPTVNDSGARYVIKLGGVTDADGTVSLAVGSNVITVEVTAEDDTTTRTYTVTVTRLASLQQTSTDATLSGLTLSDVNFGTFASGTTSYTADVANSVTETTVTPTVNHSGASYVVKLGGVTDSDGVVSLATGSNVITVEVTAEDDSTTKTYTVTVTRAAAPISAPDLDITFVYTFTNPWGYSPSFTLGVNVKNQGSGSSGSTTLRYYRSTDSAITSGDTEVGTDAVDSLAASGISRETIDLIAPSAPGTYYYGACVDAVPDESDTTNNCSGGMAFTVPAETSTDATLSGLSLSDVNFGTFASGTTAYSAQVANSVTETTVTPTVNHSGATYVIKLGGVTDAGGVVSLATGSNVITVEVTAEDDSTTKTYTVTVTRAAAPISAPDLVVPYVSTFTNLWVYDPSFTLGVNVINQGSGSSGSTTLRYYRSTDSAITSGDAEVGTDAVDGLAASERAIEGIDLIAPSAPGTYYYGACVDAVSNESDTTNNCSPAIAFTVPAETSTDATLSGLSLSDVNFGTFASGTTAYSAQVANSVTETTVTPTVNDSEATYVIKLDGVTDADGVVSLSVGSNVITIEVTAEDDTTTQTYTVTVTRLVSLQQNSTDATLSALTLSGINFGAFSSDTDSYTASVAYSVSQTTVTPTVNDSGATYVIKLGGVTDADGVVSLSVGRNDITIEVTAEDDTTQTYTIAVTRASPSSDATLSALTLSSIDFGTFASGTTSYSAQVANSVSQTTVTPTVNDSGATYVIKLGGVTDADGVVSLSVGRNDITIEVTAEDDDTTQTYTIAVTRASPSSDATLSALTLSSIDFGTFASGTTSYSAQVANSVSQTTVTPTVNDSGATYVIKLGGVTDADGVVSLSVGRNDITIEVTAEDDDTTQTYTVAVTRASPSSDATLSALTLSSIDFGTFASGTTSYTADVANSVTETTVTPTVNHSGASYVIKLGGVTDADGVVSLSVGRNDITIEVTAEDDDTTQTYTVAVTRASPSSDATLSALTLSSIDFGTFASGTTSYTAQVANSVSQTTVTPTVNDSGATYVIKLGGVTDADGVVSLSVGRNVITVEVTAEDDSTTKTYTVTVTRAAAPISAPDLVVPYVSTVTNLWVYDPSFTLGVNVINQGSGSSGSTTLRYYRSTDSAITSGDAEVGTDAVDGLAASERAIEGIDLIAPSAPGTYYYGACVDAVSNESDTTNNCSPAIAFTVPAETSTDATLSGLSLSDVNFGTFASGTTAYSAQVANSVTETTVTPTVNHSGATYVIKLGGVTDADGVVSLSVGRNVITVEVTAEDDSTTKTYTVTVSRAGEDRSLTPSPNNTVVAGVLSTARYTVTFQGQWTIGVTPGGLPGGAHFSPIIGAVHNAEVTFLKSGEAASSGVESMAETGGTSELQSEVNAAINAITPTALSVLSRSGNIGRQGQVTLNDVAVTTDHPRVTLVTMIAPSPDWFVGVSGLSLLDASGNWLPSHEVKLNPWDAGTENGDEFSPSNLATSPHGVITSIAGVGKFSTESIATLTFTLRSANSEPTGAPFITGAAEVGEVLTASTSGIDDADGLTNASFAYQWLADDAEIDGATASTYTLVANDAGKAIKVMVSFTDDAGNDEELTSAATGAVAAAAVVKPPLTATVHGVPSSHNGQDAFTFELRFSEDPKPDFSYTTVRDHAFTVTGGSVTYVRRLESGENVRWEITVTPGSSAAVAIALNATTDCSATGAICTEEGRKLSGGPLLVVTGPNSPATGEPTITGTAQVGETLTAGVTGISDSDGLNSATFAYQWLADDVEIDGATANSYTLTDTEAGKTIKVRVSFTDDAGNDEELTSAATGAVAAAAPPPNTPATGAPSITGTAQVGETLTAGVTGISDSDDLNNAAFSYQWLADDVEIDGATANSYTLTDTEAGKAIKVRVSFTDDAGNDEELTSAATGAVAAAAPPPNTPATGAPSITGTAQVGETLTAGVTGISDGDGLNSATFAYQWLADDVEINGATASTYTLADAEAGKAIKVRVSFTDDAGNDEELTSAATGAVAAAAVVKPPLTATVHGVPSSHNGQDAFTFELRFSEDPKPDFSYTTVRDHAFTVTGGSVTYVRRLESGENVRWEITVTPGSSADVAIALNATTDCEAEGAICTEDGKRLSASVSASVSGPASVGTVPVAVIVSGTTPVAEGEMVSFTISLNRAAPTALSVAVSVADAVGVLSGTAPRSVAFATGDNSKTITLSTRDDNAIKTASTVTVSLATGSGYTLGTATSASVSVTDNDTAVWTVEAQPTEIAEGESSTITLGVANGKTFAANQTVSLTVSGSASGSDYRLSDTELTLQAGASSVTATVAAKDDTSVESDETVIVTATHDGQPIGSATVTIEDNDVAVWTVEAQPTEIAEGGSSTITLGVANGKTFAANQTVSLAVSGSASGSDYSLSDTELTLQAGASSVTATVTARDDTSVESDETVIVTATLDGQPIGSATVTIEDNDTPVWSVVAEPAKVAEGAASTVTVSVDKAFEVAQTITLALGGTATSGDYSLSSSSLTLGAGDTSVMARVTAVDDSDEESDETVVVTASHGGGAVGSATVIIEANDTPVSSDAALSSLALSGVDIGGFDADNTAYAASVGNGVSSTTVTAVASDDGASVVIADGDGETRGTSRSVSLVVGDNAITVTVTAEDAVTTKTYAITVTRAEPDVAPLPPGVVWGARLPDLDIALPGVGSPSGVWSDGTDVWVVTTAGKISVYSLADGSEHTDRGFTLPGRAEYAAGLWSDGATLWVADVNGGWVRAYRLSDGARQADRDLNTARNREPTGIWSDGATMWVADYTDSRVYAYDLASKARVADKEFDLTKNPGETYNPFGIWSNGDTLLAASWLGGEIIAHSLADGQRQPAKDLSTFASRTYSPNGIWSNGHILWVLDNSAATLYAYAVPGLGALDTATWSVVVDPVRVAEGEVSTVTVSVDKAFAVAKTITLAVTGGTAEGGDYSLSTSTLTLGVGDKSVTARVTAVDDNVIDGGDETVIVTATHDGQPIGSATVTIEDNDTPTWSVVVDPVRVAEGEVSTVTVSVDKAFGIAQAITLAVTGGTAEGGDYSLSGSTLTLDAGDKSVTARVTAVDDNVIDGGDETVIVTATHDGQPIGSATVTIEDNDTPTWSVVADPPRVAEGAVSTITLGIANGKTFAANQTVSLAVFGTASGSDYSLSATEVTLQAGASSVTATVTARDDTSVESDETVIVTATHDGQPIGSATVTIEDNDTPTWSVVADPVRVAEGEVSTVTVSVDKAFAVAQTITLAVTGGTAEGGDYSLSGSTLTLDAGDKSVTARLTAVDDNDEESDETVVVTASHGGSAIGSATVIIEDNDTPVWSVSADPVRVAEGEVSTVTVSVDKAFAVAQTITLAVTGGLRRAGTIRCCRRR